MAEKYYEDDSQEEDDDQEVEDDDDSEEEKPKKKRVTKKKETKKRKNKGPKKAQSAYMFFANTNRNAEKDKNPGIAFADLAKHLGALWKSLTPDQKKVCFDPIFKLMQEFFVIYFHRPAGRRNSFGLLGLL
jgi:hypothetical protein